MSSHWVDMDDRPPWPSDMNSILLMENQIMQDLYGPITHDTDVTIEMVNEVARQMRRLYKPRWMSIVHYN